MVVITIVIIISIIIRNISGSPGLSLTFYVAQDNQEFRIFLPPPKCWDHRPVSLHLVKGLISLVPHR